MLEWVIVMIELLKSHTSVRKYTDEPIPKEKLYEMLEAAQYASSSHFVQAYSVIHVTDREKMEELGKLSKNERQFETAAAALLFCADLKRLEHAAKFHDEKLEGKNVESFIVPIVDTAIFAQNFVVAAEAEGYGICYIGGVRNNPKEISELFELPNYVIPLFGMTVGVPARQNEVKPRLPLEAVVHENRYDETKYESLLKEYDETMREYYRRRTRNKKDLTWTKSMADFVSVERRKHMKEFVQSKGFLQE